MNIKFYLLNILAFILAGRSLAQVTVSSTDSLTCTVPCTTLIAHVIGDTPTNAGVTADDIYSGVIPIGFPFNFYGNVYTQCLLGANGDINFNVADAGGFDAWNITGPLLGTANKENCICGPWCDIDIFYTSTVIGLESYSTDGVAPFRKFSVTWCACSMYYCPTQLTTTEIILYETTNIIEVHISQKLVCSTWNGGYAIVGVQNSSGTAATTAPGRDYPSVWSIPPTEAWRFTPNTTYTSYAVASIPYAPIPYDSSLVYWYNTSTGAYLGSGDSITVCPTTTTTYGAAALGCGADTSWGYYTVVPSATLIISTSFTNPTLCGVCDGTMTISGLTAGMHDTISYDYNGVPQPPIVAVASLSGTVILSGLCAGIYSDIVARQGACPSTPAGPDTLLNPAISMGVTTSNPTACGVCDGYLVLTGLYPSHIYTVSYLFNGAAQPSLTVTSTASGTDTISGLCAGTYSGIVASFGACATPAAGPYTLTAPAPPPVFIISSKNPSQCGYCDGSIVIGNAPPGSIDTITYNLNGVAQPPVVVVALSDSSLHIPNLCGGTYSDIQVMVWPCLRPTSTNVILDSPVITASFTQSIHWGCHGDTVLFTNLSSASGPLYYIWNFGDGTSDTATNPYHVFAQGIYTVTLTATDHYCYVEDSATDSLEHPLVAGLIASPEIVCQNSPVTFTDSSVGTGLSFLWFFGTGASSNFQNTTYTYTKVGAYTVTHVATDFVPCHDTATVNIQVDSLSPMSIDLSDSVLCLGGEVAMLGIYTTIGNTGVVWTFGDGNTVKNQNPVYYSYTTAGVFTVTATALFRVCPDTTASRTIAVFQGPVVNIPADTAICPGGNPLVLNGQSYATNANTAWVWSTGATTPSITVTAPGTYWLDASLNGCHTSDTVKVLNNCYLNIPNVFTPNGDGLNDYFFPRQLLARGLTSFSMQVFNRWGQQIFSTTSTDGEGWDGKFNGVDQPEGVYVYIIDATFVDGQHEHHQGNLTLLR